MQTITVDTFAKQATMILTMVIIVKYIVTVSIQGRKRFATGTRPPEDQKLIGSGVNVGTSYVQPQIQAVDNNNTALEEDIRWQRIVANDLESLPFGMIVAVLSLLSAANKNAHIALYTIFVVSRVLHTIAYARAAQPWRTIWWTLGWLGVFGMGINGIIGLY